ncbi:putative transposon protein [Symbiodinium microadriaticum]|uniref:Putative transposon protein n=1 Tax=Symbiodinium microadriaticum TaxID=2951 RepID=A0A1Q9EYB6_SYMMI|nr:putative transposon protein [Symbiodinium microadriaticum]
MRAQSAGPGIEGEDRAPNYEAALPNGVSRPEASPQSIQSLPWSPSMAQSAEQRAGEEGSELRLAAPRIPGIGQAASGSGERFLEAHSGAPRSPTATADWPPALKWMGRLNEFLQRASGPVETFTAMTRQQFSGSREGGLVVQQEHTYRRQAASPLHTPEAQQQQQPRPAVSTTTSVAPLFSASAQQTMDGWASQAPLLYGHAPLAQQEGSDRASSTSIPRELVQEEVRRQVMEAMQVQSAQLEELRRENERLRARQDLEVRTGAHQDDQDLEQHQGAPQGDRALRVQRSANQMDQGLDRGHSVPQGDRALGLQQSIYQGGRALGMQQSVPPDDRALGLQQSVPPGDRALGLQHSVPPGDRAFTMQPSVPPGDRAFTMQSSVPLGDRADSRQLDVDAGEWDQSNQFRKEPSVRPLSVRFGMDPEPMETGTTASMNPPFTGLLQGDVCGVSNEAVPQLFSSTGTRLRGDYGNRPRSRTPSRERAQAYPPPPPGLPPRRGPQPAPSGPCPGASSARSIGNPLETLVAGMTQIQEVLLRGRSSGEAADYDPSKSVVEFPKLKENSSESGAIDFQDWLYLVEQQVGSMASGAATWWSGMVTAAMTAYGKYQASTPIQRLSISAVLPSELEDPKFSKLEKRVAALLVAALPQVMREEMVAYRVRRVHQQLFRLLVCYQPGGSSDRALVLAQLDPKEGSNDVSEVATSLRRWFRWLQRAQDLQLSLPDPSVQIKALTSLTKKLADRNSDFQFKIALARTELRVDSRPNQDTALRYFQHLLAEVEQMGPTKAKASAHTATSSATAQALAVASDESSQRPRGGQGTQPKTSAPTSPKESGAKGEGKGACKWFTTDQGCSRGRACRFLHDWSQVVKAERCLVCGSKLHKVKECPRRDLEPGSGSPEPKGLNRKELKALASMSMASQVATSGTTTTTGAKAPPPAPASSASVMTPAAMAAADPPLPPLATGDALKEMLAETTKALRALTTTATSSTTMEQQQPAVQDPLQLMARGLRKFTLRSLGEKMALLDSGASHAYRKANDGDERERAHPVSVKLAQGETTLLQNEAGTLLGESTAETLVPLGQLVEVLGCSVRWTKNKLVVVHPVHGRLKVQVRDFCPELAEHEALRLIAELEEKRLRELNTAVQSLELKVAQSGRVMEWYEYVQDYVASGGRVDLLAAISKAPFFKDFPIERITTAAEGIPICDRDGWLLLKSIPWSRRRRRSLFQSKGEFEQVAHDEKSLRKAQQMTGELLWLSTKSRPDLMHSVASMSSLCLRDPVLVERIGLRALSYLYTTASLSLLFGGTEAAHEVTAYSDASFSPSGGRSIGCSLVTYNGNAVAWRSGRQSLVALSTAEAELIEAVASDQLQAGIAALTLYDLVALWGLVNDSENETVLVVLYCLTQPVAARKTKPDLEVDFAWELYGLVFLLVVAGIALWEALKRIWGRFHPDETESREARRLRKLQSAVREELHGMGLATGPTAKSSSSASSAQFAPAPTYSRGSEDYPPPPPPYPTGGLDDLPELEELRGRKLRPLLEGLCVSNERPR